MWSLETGVQILGLGRNGASLTLGSEMAQGQDMEEDDVFGRSTVLKNRKDTVVGQETPTQSFDNTGGAETAWGA